MMNLREESGQSSIEFVMALLLALGFTGFFINTSFVAAYGNYAQYATYMSARAYLSASATDDDQRQRARAVLITSVKKGQGNAGSDRWPGLAKGLTPANEPGTAGVAGMLFDHPQLLEEPQNARSRDYSWLMGVRYTFRSPLLLGGFGGEAGAEMEMTSEAWLGREPTYIECREFMASEALNGLQEALYDNGC